MNILHFSIRLLMALPLVYCVSAHSLELHLPKSEIYQAHTDMNFPTFFGWPLIRVYRSGENSTGWKYGLDQRLKVQNKELSWYNPQTGLALTFHRKNKSDLWTNSLSNMPIKKKGSGYILTRSPYQYSFDESGWLSEMRRGRLFLSISRDKKGQILRIEDFYRNTWLFSWEKGRPTKIEGPRKLAVKYIYNEQNQLESVWNGNTQLYSYKYKKRKKQSLLVRAEDTLRNQSEDIQIKGKNILVSKRATNETWEVRPTSTRSENSNFKVHYTYPGKKGPESKTEEVQLRSHPIKGQNFARVERVREKAKAKVQSKKKTLARKQKAPSHRGSLKTNKWGLITSMSTPGHQIFIKYDKHHRAKVMTRETLRGKKTSLVSRIRINYTTKGTIAKLQSHKHGSVKVLASGQPSDKKKMKLIQSELLTFTQLLNWKKRSLKL